MSKSKGDRYQAFRKADFASCLDKIKAHPDESLYFASPWLTVIYSQKHRELTAVKKYPDGSQPMTVHQEAVEFDDDI